MDRWTFFASAGCLTAFFGIFVYVQYVSPLLTGRRILLEDWEREIPGLIGIATVLGCLGFVFMSAMLWPAYHLGAPVILFFEWAGAVAAMTLW